MRTTEGSTATTQEYIRLVDVVADAGIERNISLKLKQLGIDMENSPYTERTLEIFETLWEHQCRSIGVAL